MDEIEFGSADAASMGGKARAKAMSDDERRESARRAAEARWAKHGKEPVPKATHEGPLVLKGMTIECAVLEDKTRVLSENAFCKALDVVRGGYQYRRRLAEGEGDLPIFLASPALKPFIPDELRVRVTKPSWYVPKSTGQIARGIDVTLIPEACHVWMEARRAGALSKRGCDTAELASILLRGLGTTGIVALVDEATGYQDDRERGALAKILEAFVQKELKPWVHTFPLDYYRELYRLKGRAFPPKGNRMPRYFGIYTNDIVYARLAPGVLPELHRLTPRRPSGRLKEHLHRRLTGDVGHPKLLQHIGSVVALMKVSNDRDFDGFLKLLDRLYPRQTAAPLFDNPQDSDESDTTS